VRARAIFRPTFRRAIWGLTLCSENCHIKTTNRLSETFRTAVGHTLYDRTINQEIREELILHNLEKNYSGI